jgi:hypothetical protein
MDTQARRDIWAMLAKKRQGRCIILTTHFMDEADVLGDSIAVLHGGKLQIAGTSAELKAQFASGINIDVSVGPYSDRRGILNLLRSVGGGAEGTTVNSEDTMDAEGRLMTRDNSEAVLELSSPGDFHMTVPTEAEAQMGRICRTLDRAVATGRFGVMSYGFVSTTLDEVFVKLGELGTLQSKGTRSFSSTKVAPQLDDQGEGAVTFEERTLSTILPLLLARRFMCESRNKWTFIMNLILPILFVAFACVMISAINISGSEEGGYLIRLDSVSGLAESPYNGR